MSGPLDPTQFTRESAERIANVVRAAELSAPVARPLTFERVDFVRNQKSFRIATFTGSWPTGTDKTVTFKYGSTATAVATNLFFPITRTAAAGDCAIAKDGTAWFLIDVPFETATAVFASTTVLATVFGTGSTSLIRFIGTGSTSTITFAGSASTSSITFLTGVSASLNTASCAISVTASTATATITTAGATQTATSISMSGTQTAISVSMAGTQTITVVGATFTSAFLRFKV